jgi:hypothetical protein
MVSSWANQGILCYFPLARETILLISHGTKGNYQGKVQFPLAGETGQFSSHASGYSRRLGATSCYYRRHLFQFDTNPMVKVVLKISVEKTCRKPAEITVEILVFLRGLLCLLFHLLLSEVYLMDLSCNSLQFPVC